MKPHTQKSRIIQLAGVCFAIAICFSTISESALAATRRRARRAVNSSIKAMPITQRPDRPGHFYGNTVRRVYRFTDGRVNLDDLRPK